MQLAINHEQAEIKNFSIFNDRQKNSSLLCFSDI